jgi:hypothetical protein
LLIAVLTVDGLHVPVIPSFDVVGSTGAGVALAHIVGIGLNCGLAGFVFTVTVSGVVTKQRPATGVAVKIYVPVARLLTVEGFQLPGIPSFDTRGNTGAVALMQIGATAANVGVSFGSTVTVAVPLNVLGQPPPVMLTRFIV